ncbi:MAG: hypothetical protein WC011_02575 [Candidatus Paceibacterota bacterium]
MVNYFFKKIILALLIILSLFPFYVIRAVDIIDSDDVVVSARVIDTSIVIPPTPTSLGGGGAVNLFIPKIGVALRGEAYPNAKITLLKGGIFVLSVNADNRGFFNMSIEEKYENTALYTIFAEDSDGNKSLLLNYPVAVYSGYITELSNIRFAPTISLDKSEVLEGDYITIYGYAMPDRSLYVSLDGLNQKNFLTNSLSDGSYKITIPMTDLSKGSYSLNIKYLNDTRISKLVKFIIGDSNKNVENYPLVIQGDCNKDNLINLIDFSVMAFWYKKDNPPSCVDVNSDNVVNLIDFSILAYFWTN